MRPASDHVLAVTGLKAEARIAIGAGVAVIACGGHEAAIRAALVRALESRPRGLVSFGVAGGLDPTLAPGAVVVASEVVAAGGARYAADRRWAEALAGGAAKVAAIAGVPRAASDPCAKRALHGATGAAAVDMESHLVAEAAAAHGLPFVALRVVADPAERALPEAAVVALKPDGGTDARAVLARALRDPRQMAGLMRCAMDARVALAALRRERGRLGAGLGLFDLAHLGLDVA
jgi:hopanoid-associated phosphorylase